MNKQVFHVGDVVDIVPHENVRDDFSIGRSDWERERSRNPHVIDGIEYRDGSDYIGCYTIKMPDEEYSFCWPPDAFVLHEEPVRVEVGDLL